MVCPSGPPAVLSFLFVIQFLFLAVNSDISSSGPRVCCVPVCLTAICSCRFPLGARYLEALQHMTIRFDSAEC